MTEFPGDKNPIPETKTSDGLLTSGRVESNEVGAADCWVWDGTNALPANMTVWDGTAEVRATVTVA